MPNEELVPNDYKLSVGTLKAKSLIFQPDTKYNVNNKDFSNQLNRLIKAVGLHLTGDESKSINEINGLEVYLPDTDNNRELFVNAATSIGYNKDNIFFMDNPSQQGSVMEITPVNVIKTLIKDDK